MSLAIAIVHILVCLFLILIVLLQTGKGADISGAAFGWRRIRPRSYLEQRVRVAF